MAVADDQFALTPTDGHQRIDDLEAGLNRLVNALARDNAWSLDIHTTAFGHIRERALTVDGLAQGIYHAAKKALAHGHVDDFAQATDFIAFGNFRIRAENHDADIVALQVQGHALDPGGGELHHLAGLDLIEAIDAGDSVADAQDLADIRDIGLHAEIGDLALKDVRNFSGANIH